jgi:hypothetical protein
MHSADVSDSSFSLHPPSLDSEGGTDGITVTDITDGPPAAPAAGVLGSVLGVYEQHGYDAGYRRAVQDVLLSLLGVTEQFIRQQGTGGPSPEDLRRVVWALHEDLERRLAAGGEARSTSGEVEGGLGI